jgi:hypothetical protein
MKRSQEQSRPLSSPPESRILKTKHSADGLSSVTLDNGLLHTITIVTRAEDFGTLVGSDLAEIRAHLMTRAEGHFRRK